MELEEQQARATEASPATPEGHVLFPRGEFGLAAVRSCILMPVKFCMVV